MKRSGTKGIRTLDDYCVNNHDSGTVGNMLEIGTGRRVVRRLSGIEDVRDVHISEKRHTQEGALRCNEDFLDNDGGEERERDVQVGEAHEVEEAVEVAKRRRFVPGEVAKVRRRLRREF